MQQQSRPEKLSRQNCDGRDEMIAEGLIHGQSRYPVSFTLITAVILLVIGLFAIFSMVFNVGPFTDGA